MHVSTCVFAHVNAGACGGPKRVLETLELELVAVVSFLKAIPKGFDGIYFWDHSEKLVCCSVVRIGISDVFIDIVTGDNLSREGLPECDEVCWLHYQLRIHHLSLYSVWLRASQWYPKCDRPQMKWQISFSFSWVHGLPIYVDSTGPISMSPGVWADPVPRPWTCFVFQSRLKFAIFLEHLKQLRWLTGLRYWTWLFCLDKVPQIGVWRITDGTEDSAQFWKPSPGWLIY